MREIWQRHNGVDYDDVLGYLKNDKLVKIYFRNSLETVVIWHPDNVILIQNNMVNKSIIHDLQDMDTSLNGELLEVIVDNSLFVSDASDISLVKTTDFHKTLADLD